MTGAVVAVLGQVADGEVHATRPSVAGAPRRSSARRCRGRRATSSSWTASQVACRSPPSASARPRNSRSALRRCRRSTGSELRGLRVGAAERVVHGVDRRGDASRGRRARRAGSARPGSALGGAGHRAAVGLEAADGLQQRERLAVSTVLAARRASGGSATRSIRRTMSADSMRPPAARNARGLVAQHRARGQAPEQRAALLDVAGRPSTGPTRRRGARGRRLDEREVGGVDRLPHLGRDDVAHRARALAGAPDARDDRASGCRGRASARAGRRRGAPGASPARRAHDRQQRGPVERDARRGSSGRPCSEAWKTPSSMRAVCSARARLRPSQNSSWAIRASTQLLLLLLLLADPGPRVAQVGHRGRRP